MRVLFFVAIALSLLCCVLCKATERTDVQGRLAFPTKQANTQALANVKVTLNGHEFSTFTNADGSFTFHQVPVGIYTLDALSPHILFPVAKIKISSAASNTDADTTEVTVVEYKYPGAARQHMDYPIVLKALTMVGYFKPPPSFSIWSMIMANPMMIIMLGFGGLMVFMFQNMDPELMKEIQEQNKNKEDPTKMVQDMMSGKGLSAMFGGAKDDDDDD